MKEDRTAGVLAAVLVAVGAACLLLWRRGHPRLPADYALWALAITIGGAVTATFLIVVWQHQVQERRQARLAAERRAGRADAAYQLGVCAEVLCKKMIEHTQEMQADPTYIATAAGELHAIGIALEKYDPVDFASYDELKPLTGLIAARASLTQQLRDALQRTDSREMSAELHTGFSRLAGNIAKDVAALQGIARAKKIAASEI